MMKSYFLSVRLALVATLEDFLIHIRLSYRSIPFRTLVSDLVSICLSIGFVIIPSLLFGLCLLVVPQGRDAFLLVIEKMIDGYFQQFFFLLFSICCWAYASELGVRYAIAVSDNSGLNLSEQRVRWRKAVQRMLAAFFLIFPFLVVLFEMVRLLFLATYISWIERGFYIGMALLILILLFSAVLYLYFVKIGDYGPGRPQRTLLGKRSLPATEQSWLNKLYGIYNDFTFTLPKASGLKKMHRAAYESFVSHLLREAANGLSGLPQDENVFTKGRMVPSEFSLLNEGHISTQTGYVYKWVYHVPSSFYKVFHSQVRRLLTWSVIVVIVIAVLPADGFFFRNFGAPGLICLAFACYTGIYIGLLYVDKAVLRKWRFVSMRLLFLILFLSSSYFNRDHPARVSDEMVGERIPVKENFEKWFAQYKEKYQLRGKHVGGKYPVLFICAEGGALRTGAYTGIFLNSMEQVLSESEHNIDFRSSVYGMSGVSGGAVGLGYYNAVAFREGMPVGKQAVDKAKSFFTNDSLSALIGKMLFGEFINLFIPVPIQRFDRAVALEKTWEYAYQQTFGRDSNSYQADFVGRSEMASPTLIINTTEVETGLQCMLVNHRMDSLRFGTERDLFGTRVGRMSYATALNFSSRFPLFSPAAAVKQGKGLRHFVDGGYVENTGSSSMLELLKEINRDGLLSREVVPVVITLLFAADDQSREQEISWFNELSEILYASYNTRSGRTRTSRAELKEMVRSLGGIPIDAPFRSEQVPMNWVLSGRSISELERNVKNMLDPRDTVMKSFKNPKLEYLNLSQ